MVVSRWALGEQLLVANLLSMLLCQRAEGAPERSICVSPTPPDAIFITCATVYRTHITHPQYNTWCEYLLLIVISCIHSAKDIAIHSDLGWTQPRTLHESRLSIFWG